VVEASGKLRGSATLNGQGYIKPKLAGFWRGWLAYHFANHPAVNSNALSELAQRWAERLGRDDAPKRAIAYRYQAAFKQLPEEVQKGFRTCEWPQAMYDGALPWEASGEVVALLNWVKEQGLPPPTISVAKWFWRTSLVVPDAPLESRLALAITASTHEETNKEFPEDLLRVLVNKAIPTDYQPRIADGAGSEIWCRLALPLAYPGGPGNLLFPKELLLVDGVSTTTS
jgi:hypothetical protein